jgi:hypothetical protein
MIPTRSVGISLADGLATLAPEVDVGAMLPAGGWLVLPLGGE